MKRRRRERDEANTFVIKELRTNLHLGTNLSVFTRAHQGGQEMLRDIIVESDFVSVQKSRRDFHRSSSKVSHLSKLQRTSEGDRRRRAPSLGVQFPSLKCSWLAPS
jgi:hypothetical protein